MHEKKLAIYASKNYMKYKQTHVNVPDKSFI